MKEVTSEQVRDAVRATGRRSWKLRECSICHAPLHYLFADDGGVFYQSACDCTSYPSPPQPRDWSSVAHTLNIQMPEVRARMWADLTTVPAVAP